MSEVRGEFVDFTGAVDTAGIKRERDRILVKNLLTSVAKHGAITEESCHEAVAATHQEGKRALSKKWALKTVLKKLHTNPNIRKALADAYHYVDPEFDVGEMISLHIGHMRSGNYKALKDGMDMMMPMPAKKVEIGISSVGQSMLTNVPLIAPRALGPATVADADEAQVVELPDGTD